jgi:hypothetical protein
LEAFAVFVTSRKFVLSVVVVGVCSFFVLVSRAQTPNQISRPPTPPKLSPDQLAEREKIWNSANMLRARAWLQDYCSKSAKVTPEMAKRYQEELANMTPSQMEVWLLKFDHEEQQRQQQFNFFQQAHSLGMQRAEAANQASQKSLNQFTQDQNKAAVDAQQQMDEQREFRQAEAADNMPQPMGPSPYLYPGYSWLWGHPGGVHYHYHYAPY